MPGGQNNQAPSLMKRSARDYQFGARIGEGSYSTVFSALDIHSKKTYAIKVLSKRHIVKEDKIKYVNIEKTTLHRLGQQHPGIVQLYYTFQDESSLFFVLDFAEYGELLSIIRKFGSLSEAVLKFYMCQIIDAVKFIHLKGIIHRDLKPENILVDRDFNLKITDFGAAKLLDSPNDDSGEQIDYDGIQNETGSKIDRKGSFVGTAEYVSPELLKHNICGFESDVWAMGCILYQFFSGVPPFKGTTEYSTFEKIINVEYSYRQGYYIPQEVVHIIDNILVADPEKRYTIPQIMACSWFNEILWNDQNYIWKRKTPRFEPYNASYSNGNSSSYPNTLKTGTGKVMNKSASYQQLHSQIQQSDFVIPTISSSKAYQPASKLKKSFIPPGQMVNTPNMNPNKQNLSYIAQNQNMSKDQQVRNVEVNPPVNMPMNTQMNQQVNQMNNQLKTNQNGPPRSISSRQIMNNVDTNGVVGSEKKNSTYNNGSNSNSEMQYRPQFNSSPQNTYSNHSVQINQGNTSSKESINRQTGQPRQPYSVASTPSLQLSVSSNFAAAAAAAIGGANLSQPPATVKQPERKTSKPVTQKISTQKVSSPKIPTQRLSTPKSSSPKSSDNSPVFDGDIIKFKEISLFLDENEKILKMNILIRSQLTNRILQRNLKEPLDDVIIEQLVSTHEDVLKKNEVPVVAVITNKARVFFIEASLNVMLVDLKANHGGDYLMYDYDFENDTTEYENSVMGDEANGYLILELIKDGGDLIFLRKPLITDKLSLRSSLKVVNNLREPITLGDTYGWIHSLLLAKEMVSKDLGSKKPAPKKSVPLEKPKSQPPKSRSTKDGNSKKSRNSSSASSSTSNVTQLSKVTAKSPTQSSVSKFAYAAAAAAHK